MIRRAATACATALVFVVHVARAEPPSPFEEDSIPLGELEDEALGPRGNMRTRAEGVSFDAKQKSIELTGNVRIDAPPFHLRSPKITLVRTRYGIEVDGDGRLTFCPCLGTPLTIEFTKAIVAPPGELLLRDPKLEIYGVPVFYLPWFWMRSEEKIGVLPPDVAYRGQDGVFLGDGVHLPFKHRGGKNVLDLRSGAYLAGGFVADGRLRTPSSETKLRYDRLPGARAPLLLPPGEGSANADDGLFVDARGATPADVTTVAWDVDMLRGRRAVAATTDLDAAAKPYDRATGSGAVRLGPLAAEIGARAVTRRGGDLTVVEASGPFVALRTSGAAGSSIAYDVAVEGGSLRTSGPAAGGAAVTPNSVSYARIDAGALAASTIGPLAASLTARAAGDVAAEDRRDGTDRGAAVRLRLAAPLARSFDVDEHSVNTEPLVHVIEPFVEASLLHADGSAILETLPGRGLAALHGTAPLTSAGLTTTLGRWGAREAVELSLAGGAAYGSSATASGVRPLARGRLSATFASLGADVETGHVVGSDGGDAVVTRLRVGRLTGPRVIANLATRDRIDPLLARALTDASVEAPAGFLSATGTTGGAGLFLPWTKVFTTSVGADVDASTRELVGARVGLDLRDRCGCVTLHAYGAHRIGRDGVDVWIALDFAPDR